MSTTCDENGGFGILYYGYKPTETGFAGAILSRDGAIYTTSPKYATRAAAMDAAADWAQRKGLVVTFG